MPRTPDAEHARESRRLLRLTGAQLAVVVTILAFLSTIGLNLQSLRDVSKERDKSACLSNLKRIALATLMYAEDYNHVLPACVASDSQGTAHAVGGVFRNRTWRAFEKGVTARYGKRYFDGRWMWQLADLLRPYVKSEAIFNCPALTRQDPHFKIRSYVVGTDGKGRRDSKDPLRALIPGTNKRKVIRSGSYVYMCGHYPADAEVMLVSDYGSDSGVPFFEMWTMAIMLGQPDGPDLGASPQEHLACANALRSFAHPALKPLVMCNSLGVHEGYDAEYISDHVAPPELGGTPPPITPAAPMAFVDGHARYMRMTFYETVGMLFARNGR